MSDNDESSASKRAHESEKPAEEDDGSSDGWVGPLPTDAVPAKKRKGSSSLHAFNYIYWTSQDSATFRILSNLIFPIGSVGI